MALIARTMIRATLALLVTVVYIKTLKGGVQAEQVEKFETKTEQSLPEKIEQPQWRIAREAGRENTNGRQNRKPSNKKMKGNARKTKTKLRQGKKKIRQKKTKSKKMRTNKRKHKHKKKKKKKPRNNNKRQKKKRPKKNQKEKLWRDDGKCGPRYPLPNGQPGQCDPTANANKKGPCCSNWGWCGNSDRHCNCPNCVRFPGDQAGPAGCGIQNGKVREEGESWKDSDGCNTCVCSGGSPSCTLALCDVSDSITSDEKCSLRDWIVGGYQCSPKHTCNIGQGDCQTDEDCDTGLFCGKNNCWGEFGYKPQGSLKDDCCTDHLNYCSPADIVPRSRITCCSPDSPCSDGHGDCDTDTDCESGLVCGHNNCQEFHPDADDKDDCCVDPLSGSPCTKARAPSFSCSAENPCNEGEGDCEHDDDTCAGELVCGSNNCRACHPTADPKMDCCVKK